MIEKIEELIALAGSANEHEARAAASGDHRTPAA